MLVCLVCQFFLSLKLQNTGAPNTHARDICIECCKLCKTSPPVVWNIKTAARSAEALYAIFPWRRGTPAQVFSESRCLPWARESVHFYWDPLFRTRHQLPGGSLRDAKGSSGQPFCVEAGRYWFRMSWQTVMTQVVKVFVLAMQLWN
jgi:hypothetical protein